MFHVIFQVIAEDLERRVEESKKEYDHVKEKAKEVIIHSIVQTKVVLPTPSNGITAAVPENISSTTPNKYAFTPKFSYIYINTHILC